MSDLTADEVDRIRKVYAEDFVALARDPSLIAGDEDEGWACIANFKTLFDHIAALERENAELREENERIDKHVVSIEEYEARIRAAHEPRDSRCDRCERYRDETGHYPYCQVGEGTQQGVCGCNRAQSETCGCIPDKYCMAERGETQGVICKRKQSNTEAPRDAIDEADEHAQASWENHRRD